MPRRSGPGPRLTEPVLDFRLAAIRQVAEWLTRRSTAPHRDRSFLNHDDLVSRKRGKPGENVESGDRATAGPVTPVVVSP